jgi:hypothetical protein
VRRGSTASNSERRRNHRAAPNDGVKKSKNATTGSRVQKLTPAGSRSATPEVHSPLVRENSFTSVSSLDSERSPTPGAGDGDSTRSLRASANKPEGGPARKAAAKTPKQT